MTTTIQPTFHAGHVTQRGGGFGVSAFQGTQKTGRFAGPLDATKYGHYVLTVQGDDGNTVTLTVDTPDDADALAAIIGRADRVAGSRNFAHDALPEAGA